MTRERVERERGVAPCPSPCFERLEMVGKGLPNYSIEYLG